MQRIIVIGSSCAGKTSFADKLSEKLGFPHIELDQLHWLPDWVERDNDEFRRLVDIATSEDYWVLDGNYSAAKDVFWPKATTIIWLNFPFPLVLFRAVQRSLTRAITRKRLFAGNMETIGRSFFSRESIIWWVITTFHSKRTRYERVLNGPSIKEIEVIEFSRPREAKAFLDRIGDD